MLNFKIIRTIFFPIHILYKKKKNYYDTFYNDLVIKFSTYTVVIGNLILKQLSFFLIIDYILTNKI